MVPPAFSEMWQNVLPRQFNNFVQYVLEMEDPEFANDE